MDLIDSRNNILISATIAQGNNVDTGNNIVIGHEAMTYPSGGVYDNVFIGKYVGNTANNARDNTVVGTYAAGNIRSGQDNVCIGIGAGYDLKNSNYNVYAGFESGYFSTGDQNMFMGARSGYENFESDNNVFIGSHAGGNNVSSSDNVFVGNGAGMYNRHGNVNVFIGGHSGYESNSGSRGVFVGYESGRNNLGSDNVMIGTDSGKTANVSYGTFVGCAAGSNASGSNNVLVGVRVASNIIGSENVVLGSSLDRVLNSNASIVLGSNVAVANTATTICIGTSSNIASSSNSIVIGSNVIVTESSTSVVLGTSSNVASSSNSVVFGSNIRVSNASSVVLLGTQNSSVRNVSNVVVIGQLPVNAVLNNNTVYVSTPSRIAIESDASVTRFRGNVIVEGSIVFSGLSVDYNELINKPTSLSSFANDITVPWTSVTSVPPKITSVNALTTDNRVLFYGSNAVQTASTLSWNGSTQRLGVGVADPRYAMDVSGYVRSTQGYLLESDRRKKTDVRKIDNAIERIREIHGYTYEYTEYPGVREAGVVAQEVAKVLDEAVATDLESGVMSVKYDSIVALLIEAVKELDERTRPRVQGS
jgi:hypothetical protein